MTLHVFLTFVFPAFLAGVLLCALLVGWWARPKKRRISDGEAADAFIRSAKALRPRPPQHLWEWTETRVYAPAPEPEPEPEPITQKGPEEVQ